MKNKNSPSLPTPNNRKGILLVAFGSSTPVGNTTLAAFENHVRQHFPQTSIRWAFTSAHMRSRLTKAKKKIDSVEKALKRMQFEKITTIVVQPLHIIPGIEFDNLRQEIAEINSMSGMRVGLGKPLLFNKNTIAKAADALLHHLPEERKLHEPVICMGHGSWHRGSLGYAAFNRAIAEKDPLVLIGTLEGRLTIDTIIKRLKKNYSPVLPPLSPTLPPIQSSSPLPSSIPLKDSPPNFATSAENTPHTPHTTPRRIWLLPLLSVIGHHALHDMAGKTSQSWKSQLEKAGYECIPVLKGTAEYKKFIVIWTEHIEEAMQKLARAGN